MLYVTLLPVPPGDVPSIHGRAPTPGNQFYGPIAYGGAWWGIVEVGQPSFDYQNVWHFALMKSADGGASWAEVDSASHPFGQEANASVYWPGGATVYIAFKKAVTGGRELALQTLSLAAGGSWGSQIAGGPNPGGGYTGTKMVRRSDGSFVILTNTGTSRNTTDFPAQGVHHVIYDGSWQSPVLVSPNNASYKSEQIQLDAADLVRFYYAEFAFVTNTYFHRSLSAAGALGTEQTLFQSNTGHAIGVPVLWNSKVWVPYADNTGANYYPWVAVGDPAGAADPSWTTEQISAAVKIMPPNNSDNAASFAIVKDGQLYVFWVTPIPTFGSGGMNSIYYAVRNGSWAAPVLFHTEAASNASQDWFHNLSVTLRSDGQFVMLVDRIHRTGAGNTWSVTGFLGEPLAVASRRSRVFYRKPFFPPR
jgi:hypothetical protein